MMTVNEFEEMIDYEEEIMPSKRPLVPRQAQIQGETQPANAEKHWYGESP